jgi:CTP synthase
LKAAGEMKTKPTQHSVGELRKIGIQPDVLICRTERELGKDECTKIAQFCSVEPRAVIEERDKTTSVYEVPVSLVKNQLDQLIVDKLQLQAQRLDISDWEAMLERIRRPNREVTIAVVGKYIKHHDAYKSIYEALFHASVAHDARLHVRKVLSEDLENADVAAALSGCDGVLVPGGFGKRGVLGKVAAIRYARENKTPFFGICLGLQCAVIEFARNVLGLATAHSSEFDKETPHPVVALLDEQLKVTNKGGTMRLGAYPCLVRDGTHAREAYGTGEASERHRHRYEFNNDYRARMCEHGLVISGTSPDGGLVEMIELLEHPWFVGVQFHPEFKAFVGAALAAKYTTTKKPRVVISA